MEVPSENESRIETTNNEEDFKIMVAPPKDD
jgi:hypothetical protein